MISKLIEYQKAQRQHVVDKLKTARSMIEQEIEEFGYYPENDGRLNAKELCRRAGVGTSTLKNRTHESTRATVGRWLTRVKTTRPALKPQLGAGSAVTQLERSLTLLAQELDAFKLEYEKLEGRCSILEEGNDKLRTENATLRAEKLRVVNLAPA